MYAQAMHEVTSHLLSNSRLVLWATPTHSSQFIHQHFFCELFLILTLHAACCSSYPSHFFLSFPIQQCRFSPLTCFFLVYASSFIFFTSFFSLSFLFYCSSCVHAHMFIPHKTSIFFYFFCLLLDFFLLFFFSFLSFVYEHFLCLLIVHACVDRNGDAWRENAREHWGSGIWIWTILLFFSEISEDFCFYWL